MKAVMYVRNLGAPAVEFDDVVVIDQDWLQAHHGPHREESIVSIKKGSLVRDASGRVGKVMTVERYLSGDKVWLRPPNGGREWDVLIDSVTPVDAGARQEPAGAAE